MSNFLDHKNVAIIVAAGRGERAGGLIDGPKQYRLIGNRPIIAHTIEKFQQHSGISHLIIVTHVDDNELIAKACENVDQQNITLVHGGATRQQSVLNGLKAAIEMNPKFVLIHDGVRPFVTSALISDVLEGLSEGHDAVLPATAVADTLKRANKDMMIDDTISRENLYAAQTPQGFDFQTILSAHLKAEQAERFDFTDDCALIEWIGEDVFIVQGSSENTKLTTMEDIKMANDKLMPAFADVRTGNGYDVHQLVDGDHVTLCGIDIPHNKALSGHSDADVALHALTDALLATCGEGDIGDHFPPTDPQWKGAASYIFLEHAAKIIRDHGGIITNADVSLIAEQPKIGPHRQKMRESLAKILGIDVVRCSVKATTNEKIGFIGREEGIAAIATATVVYGANL
ncbi:MAG: bifunctional 2-C-methyl-D-erythritol 4-phosphate cytidylyltransferase/2-C-methyl-D-erythritol 2,4-cyclodiphosphate synthase [Lentilitoribacter sp.]